MSDSSNLLLLASGKGITGSTDSKKTNTGNTGNTGKTGNQQNPKKINKNKAKEILRYINLQRSLHLLKSDKFLTISQ